MILFRPEHAAMILDGRKTQTRRLWKKPRVKVGSVHACYTRPPFAKGGAEPFARVKITALRHEPLRVISLEDARREGYSSPHEFLSAFWRINEKPVGVPRVDVWVVDFEHFGGMR